jgi:hypothetical protein
LQVLNAGNIEVQGTSAGVPSLTVSLNASALEAGNASVAATITSTGEVIGHTNTSSLAQEQFPSLISVVVVGYGGGEEN